MTLFAVGALGALELLEFMVPIFSDLAHFFGLGNFSSGLATSFSLPSLTRPADVEMVAIPTKIRMRKVEIFIVLFVCTFFSERVENFMSVFADLDKNRHVFW